MLNRPSARATKAEAEIKSLIPAGSGTHVETIPCDLQDMASVKAAIKTIKSKYDSIDVLCNNAGVMALDDYATKDCYDVQMQTNHLSHFLLTKELFPLLQCAKELHGEARIVNHSSGARKIPPTPLKPEYFCKNGGNLGGNSNSMLTGGAKWERYHQTKLANSVFTKTLAARLDGSGIKALVAAPGLAATNLQTTANETGRLRGMMWMMKFAQSAEDGTMPLLTCMFGEGVENGEFYEPRDAMGWWGPAAKVKWDDLSAAEANGKVLWEKSEEACGSFKF